MRRPYKSSPSHLTNPLHPVSNMHDAIDSLDLPEVTFCYLGHLRFPRQSFARLSEGHSTKESSSMAVHSLKNLQFMASRWLICSISVSIGN